MEGQLPRAPGHEVVGRIDVLGSGVQGWQSVSAWVSGFSAALATIASSAALVIS
jgi:D-arabinose 1-dehydrogenase-like Zn-dependent alcohol dehydrogenase